ncbi:MAG: hypothetical protein P4M09_06230, partial [Devosia sp.]|nr:hypothetical protein [Devosia sp.]
NGSNAWAGWTSISEDVLELSCEESEVASVLRGLPGAPQDIAIVRPSLDDLYAAFQKGAP